MSRERVKVVEMLVDVTDLQSATLGVLSLISKGKGGYVCVSNVHMCMEVFDSVDFKRTVNEADLVVPDGKPISWVQRLFGFGHAGQVRGEDLMLRLCKKAAEAGISVGLYGGSSQDIVESVAGRLRAMHPGLDLGYVYSPPFRPLTLAELAAVRREINQKRIEILFVGIGCPKQERWMAANREELSAVMLGTGAAFDFIIGAKKSAPKWMQSSGLEWLHRLLSEPRRLWRRYFYNNPRFCWLVLKQYLMSRND